MTKASRDYDEKQDPPITKDTQSEDPVPLGGNEPGVLPPSVVGTSQDPNRPKAKE